MDKYKVNGQTSIFDLKFEETETKSLYQRKEDLVLGDCRKILKLIPDETIDLVVTDPPYNVQAQGCGGGKNKWNGKSRFKGGNSVFGTDECQKKLFDYVYPDEYMHELQRVVKGNSHIYLFSNDKNLAETINIAEMNGFKLMNIIVVNKMQGTYFSYYQKYCEFILFFRSTKGKAKYINDCGCGNYIECRFTRGKNKIHPSEKPVDIMETLIKNSSNEGDVVLDPFMGSGSTGVACKKLNRDFICIEISDRYYKIAKQRMEDC